MRKLIAGLYSSRESFHIYDCGEGKLEDMKKEPVRDYELRDLIRNMTKYADADTHFLVRESGNEWLCEYVVRYKPDVEIFIVGYGKNPQEAFNNVMKLLNNNLG